MADWVVTVPMTVRWETDYQAELDMVADGSLVMNYRVRGFPKGMKLEDRCFVVWNGRVRGWMEVVGMVEIPDGFQCQSTGQFWRPGKYIQRSGEFHEVDGQDMTGFRGVRRYAGG